MNKQVKQHIEASTTAGSALRKRLMKTLAQQPSPSDPEEFLYAALTELVADRVRFLLLELQPPILRKRSLRMSHRDAAFARWHRLRSHFCPRTHQLLAEGDRWLATVTVAKALEKLRVHYGAAPKRERLRAESQPPSPERPRRSRRSVRSASNANELRSAFYPAPRVQRRRERMSGGLRRASEAAYGMDVAHAEYEQSLSDSAVSFVECALPVDSEHLEQCLVARDERALLRIAGFDLANALMAMTNAQEGQWEARFVFEKVVRATGGAIRGNSGLHGLSFFSDGESGVALIDDPHMCIAEKMEAHYLTDLTGCKVELREAVARRYEFLLCSLSGFLKTTLKRPRPSKRVGRMARLMMKLIAMDYVEADYDMLANSGVTNTLRTALLAPAASAKLNITTVAWKLLQLLIKRCICDGGRGFASGNSLQQLLLDVLVLMLKRSLLNVFGFHRTMPEWTWQAPSQRQAQGEEASFFEAAELRLDNEVIGVQSDPLAFTTDGSVWFSLFMHKETFRHGVLFSLGNPSATGVPDESGVAKYMPVPLPYSDGADHKQKMPWAFIQLCIDKHRRIVVRLGSYCGKVVSAVTDVQCGFNEQVDVRVSFSHQSSLVVSVRTDSGTVVEKFPGLIDHLTSAKEVSKWNAARPGTMTLKVGTRVYVKSGLFEGVVGTLESRAGTTTWLVVLEIQPFTLTYAFAPEELQVVLPGSSLPPVDYPSLLLKMKELDFFDMMRRPDETTLTKQRRFSHFSLGSDNDDESEEERVGERRNGSAASLHAPLYIGNARSSALGVSLRFLHVASTATKDTANVSTAKQVFHSMRTEPTDDHGGVIQGEDGNALHEPEAVIGPAVLVLSLCHTVCQSPVGRARLTAPYPLELLLSSSLAVRGPLELRVSCTRLMRTMMADISVTTASACALRVYKQMRVDMPDLYEGRSVEACEKEEDMASGLPFIALLAREVETATRLEAKGGLKRLSSDAFTMAAEYVELLRHLCKRPAWAAALGTWVLDGVQRSSLTALSVLGGVYEGCRVGGHACAGEEEVYVIAKAWVKPEKEKEAVDVTKDIRVEVSSEVAQTAANVLVDDDKFWQSNGHTPHWIRLTCPTTVELSSVRMLGCGSDAYAPADVTVSVGPRKDKLREIKQLTLPSNDAWVTLAKVGLQDGDTVFQLNIQSNHKRGCDSRICAFQVLGTKQRTQLPPPSLVVARPAVDDASKTLEVVEAYKLRPKPLKPPMALLDALSEEQNHRLVAALMRASSSPDLDVRVRCLKVMESLSRHPRLGALLQDTALTMLMEKQAELSRPKELRIVREAFAWKVDKDTARKWRVDVEEQIVTFQPAGRVHRAVSLDTSAMVRGKHVWELELVEDIASDETSLFGLTALPFFVAERSELNILAPSEDLWLIRSFNGHRYHKGNSTNWAGAEALRIHPKDVVKCEYDADIGVFSVAVNQGPMVKVFDKIDAPWGLRPCVASYGNRSPVSIKVRALKSTQPVRKSSGKDFPVDAWCSSIISSHDDLLVEARYAHVLALCYDQALAVKVESDRLLPVVKRPPRVEEEMPLDVDESDGEEDKEEDRERQQQTQHQQGLADESQPMVQKVAALFEVKDEKTSGTTEEASDAPGQTDDRVGPMVAQLLNTSLFTARADVLQECASCILENLYARQLSQTLDAFFQEGLDSIDRRLPADVMSPDSLQHTLHLAYRACGEQERLAAMDELTSKSAVVAEWLCQNDSHVDLLTRVCIDLLRRVGARLLEEVKTVSWEAEKAREARSRLEDAASATASMSTTTSLSGRGSAVKGLSKPQRAFKVGAQVEARFMGHRRWYPGRISGVNPDGTYQINYHDSDQETHVPQAYIRARRGLSAALPLELVVGDEVDARYRGKAKWYPGRVSSVNTDGTFDIQYHDGDFEANVPLRLIRMSASNPVGRHAQSPSVSPPPTQRQQPVLEDFSKSDEPGSVLLVADRFKGALPEDGKPDSAQVSIINHPVEADGVVKTIKLRLADQPSGGSDRWEVLLFERAGESSTFFVVSSTPEQPHARSYIYLDPNCLTDQVAEVETKLVVLQGQYIGVMNSAGRLNVSYTPGKKKSCESWALKPVEVFYLMPRSVPNPFVGGPYRTKLWHGRAGWCATVQISSNGVATAHSLQLAKRIDDLLMSRPGPCAIPVAAMVKHCCWLLLLLLKQDKMCISRLLGFPGLIQALRRLCEHGLFLLNLDRDVGKPEDRSLWDRVLHLIAHICSCAQQDHERSGARMPTAQANEVIRLQRCFEVKANSLNRMRHQTLRLRAKGLKEQAATSLHLQRLLRCLVLLDALTRKDFVVNDHEPAKSWTEIDCSLPVAQAPIIRYEISGSRVFISEVVQPQQTSVRTQNQSQKHSVFQLQQGDELVEVNHLPVRRVLADQDLLRLALGCQRKRPSAADVESEHTLLERLSSNVETVVINGVMLHTTDSWLDDGVDDTPPPNTGTEQVTLKFRRQTGGPAESRLAESTAAITYKGVRRSSAQSHSWLDAMMTASELSQALSTRSLPPARYLSALFAASRQQLHAVDMPSPEPTEDDHSDYLSAASGDDLSTNLQISVPGAIALKLCWDSRSCVTDGSLVVSSQGQNYHGLDGMPPNVSIVSGSEIHVRLSEPEPTGGLDMAVDNGGDGPWRMAGLQNRAGAFMRLGTAAFCRTVLYCGRKSSDIVGWTNEHGRCGPHGGPQCPDCADYIARNHCGYQMVIGAAAKAKTNGVMSGRKPRALKWVDDLMYCSKKCNPKSKIPCVNCCKFLSVLIRTEGHTNIPKRLPAHFSSTRAYEHFLSNIVCVGIKLRVSPTHPSDLRNQIGTVIAAERAKPCVLRFALDNRKHTLKVATFAYRDLLLCSVQEIGGIDARGETDTDQTLEKDLSMAASFRPPPYPSSASASSGRLLSERRMAVAALDTRGIGRDEDIADDVHPDRGRQAGSNVEQFLEASDFERESLYAEYMLRYCAVGSKVRCVRTYENIEEGDIGIVQAIDAPDDLPCQALWQSNKSLYWLPWSNLSLNIRQPSFPTPRSHNKDPQTAETLPHDEDWSKICFDKAVLGPDVELFNDSRTATRMRADGWGTQKLNHVVDVKHSALKLVFRVDENASNHLLLGAIGQPFTSSDGAYKRSMMERCAWCLRADGSIYADGKQIHSPETPVRIVTGDMITLCIDISNPNRRSITFIRNGAVLGEAKGLPSRVTPAVSFGGSFQRVSIAFAQAGLTGASPFNAIPGWGFHLRVEPVFSAVRSCAAEGEAEEEEQFKAFVDMHASWTRRQDDWCIAYINAVVQSMDVPVDDLLEMSFFDVHSLDEESSKDGSRLHPLLERLVVDRAEGSGMKSAASSDEVDLASIAQRYEVLRAFNSAVVRGIGLLDLSGWRTKGSPGFALSECCSLLLDKFKLMIWQDALSVTRTQLHQFEVVLDFGKAMSRSNVADVNARHTVFAQAFRTMNSIPAKILRAHGKLYNATLRGMGSHDDGGPYRQSFSQYCKELQSIPGVGLFLPCSNRRNQIHINQDRWLPNPSARSPLQLEMFEFLGKLMGIAIRNKEYLDLRLPSLLWKYLVQQIPSIEDLRAVDLLTVTHIEERTAFFAAADEVIVDTDASFAVYSLDGKQRNLLPNGRLRAVTQENVEQWASLTTQFKLHEFDIQIEAIQRGLAAIVPQKLLLLFTWQELEMMVCGHCHTDIELLKAKTVYVECSESEPHIRYFWNVLNSFTEEQRSDYIKFVWGRARLPMRSEPWEQPHKITPFTPPTPAPGKPPIKLDECLPFAHTCYFTIDLPRYSSEDILRKKLLFAIENCPEIDGDQTDIGLRSAAMGFHIVSDDESSGEGDPEDDMELLSPVGLGQGDEPFPNLNLSGVEAISEDIDPLDANLYPYRFSLLSTHSQSDGSSDDNSSDSTDDDSESIDNFLEVDSMYIS